MTEPDTIKLLRECDAGIKMGTASIGEVLEKTTNEKLKKLLEICKEGHEKLKEEIQNKLEQCHDTGKDPNPMAQGMSWMKTRLSKLFLNSAIAVVASACLVKGIVEVSGRTTSVDMPYWYVAAVLLCLSIMTGFIRPRKLA